MPSSTLRQVTDFGPNPTGLEMYLYVPERVRWHSGMVVAVHNCGGSAQAFFTGTRFADLADEHGFVVVYPSVTRTDPQCFDNSSPDSLTHTGAGDPAAIVSMVRHVQRTLRTDPGQVYAAGLSSGAMMTNVLLGAHPEVFRGGSAMSGVPFGGFATTDGTLWNADCAEGRLAMSPKEWGDLVRAAHPGHQGPRPRIQLWHGTEDAILAYPNFEGAVAQWTDVLGAQLAHTDHPRPNWTHSVYTDAAGRIAVDAHSVEGEDHDLGYHYVDWAERAVEFFGLTDPGRD